jgi:hypothetical protein
MQLFQKMAEDSGSPKTSGELAKMTKADSLLLGKLPVLLLYGNSTDST